ncbi:hypothetical protein ES703_82955 [subsurface metagenome]
MIKNLQLNVIKISLPHCYLEKEKIFQFMFQKKYLLHQQEEQQQKKLVLLALEMEIVIMKEVYGQR